MKLSDPGIERVVIEGAIKYTDFFFDSEGIISENTFTDPFNQTLWSVIKAIRLQDENLPIELPLIRSKAREMHLDNQVELKDNLEYIQSLFDSYVEQSTVRKLAQKLLIFQLARQFVFAHEASKQELYQITGSESADTIKSLAEQHIFQVMSEAEGSYNRKIMHVGDGLEEYVQYLRENPVDIVGIPTGYAVLDGYIGGLRRGGLILVAARTNVGKSFLSDNIALHISGKLNSPIDTLYADTEMDITGHWNRLLAMVSAIPINEIEKGRFSENDYRNRMIENAKNFLKNKAKYNYININGVPFEETISMMRRWIRQNIGTDENGRRKDCAIIYDYLKLMTGSDITKNMQEYQIMGFRATELYNFASRYDLPIFGTVQMNKDHEVSQSDRIKWLSTVLAHYEVKTSEELAVDPTYNMKLSIKKNRFGMVHRDDEYINMKFEGAIGRITEGPDSKNVSQQIPANAPQRNGSRSTPQTSGRT